MCNSLKKVKVGVLSGTLYIKECDLLNNIQVEKGSNDAGLELRTLYNLKELTIPDPITHTIFSDLPALEKLTIPANYKGLTADEINGHMKTARLKEIVIPDGGNYIFEDGILYNKDKTEVIWLTYLKKAGIEMTSDTGELTRDMVTSYYDEDNRDIGVIKIAEGVTKIGDNAFCDSNWNIYHFSKLILPSTLKEIGKNAFKYCQNLMEVEIPDGVTSIGDYAFSGCSGLTSINIPDSVTSIGKGVFNGCSGLTNINVPKNVTIIGSIERCSSLTSIDIPEGTTSIDDYAFSGCSNLTSITIPESVTSIGARAFSGCNSLTSINIPESVTSIKEYAFEECNNLTIYCEASSKPSGWYNDWNVHTYYRRDIRIPVVWGYKK